MPHTLSPLRYPGGKSSIKDMVSTIIVENDLSNRIYAEPYAGGCGLALSMLMNGFIEKLYLNDIDRSIYAFWYVVLNKPSELINKIEITDITMDEWHLQRDIQKNKQQAVLLDLAFSTLFLNRTNRSGIIKAGVIGGKEQKGAYKLDCRFNKRTTINKIKNIAQFSDCIHFSNKDALDFMHEVDLSTFGEAFFCIDPPYFDKGSELYTNSYEYKDHEDVSKAILSLKSPWILTYDDKPQIRTLYASKEQKKFYLNYSAAKKRIATELLIKSEDISFSENLPLLSIA